MRKLTILGLAGILFVVSCGKKEAPSGVANQSSTAVAGRMLSARDSNLVDSSIAAHVATYYNTDVFLNKRPNSTARVISSAYSIPDRYGDPAMYVFNYDNNEGYVIISADFRYQPVLSYSESGSLLKGDPIPSMFGSWLGRMTENVVAIRDGLYDNAIAGYQGWYSLFDGNHVPPPNDNQNWVPNDPSGGETGGGCGGGVDVTKGPLLQTSWNQGCGYNDLLDDCSSGGACGHVWTGCVATAAGQILKYWADGNNVYSLNYAAMPNSGGSVQTQTLMLHLGIPANLNMNYGCDGSSADDARIATTLTGIRFNYASADFDSYNNDYNSVFSDLDDGMPVELSGCTESSSFLFWSWGNGDCHAWVCDGYRIQGNVCFQQYWYHMNWGWGGIGNNWCFVDNWSVTPGSISYTWQYAQHYTHDIQP